MKINHFKYLILLIPLFLIALVGCSEENNPLLAESSQESQNLHFIDIDLPTLDDLEKGVTLSTMVTPEEGGIIRYEFYGDQANNEQFSDCYGELRFRVKPYAVTEPVEISIQMDGSVFLGDISMEYSPHGLIFEQPAILHLYVEGVDLSSIPRSKLDDVALYYVNQESGQYEEMKSRSIYINKRQGIVEVERARLPHFSRYAMAYSD